MKSPLLPLIFILVFFLWYPSSRAQMPEKRIAKSEYIEIYKDIAMQEMKEYRIPASITLAQGILESASGNSELARKANNHFGIKCHLEWSGKTFIMDDDRANECFRVYTSPMESYKDHSVFLSTRDRYAGLFKLDILDYKGWATGLKQAGYATNPKYPELLISIIEEFELYKYDRLVVESGFAYTPVNPTIREETYRPRKKNAEDFQPVYIGPQGRQVFENNGLKFTYAREGDDFYSIARDFAIYAWQIYKYNDLEKNDRLSENQIVYLQRKKNKSTETAYHKVDFYETMYDISQMYGIKLKKLYKYNNMQPGQQPDPGQKIRLKR
ncbi:MAG: glucosaminidase domain-containing protein [Bacteroidales bacterium]|nr:glucosaminidase domain-containing protein [Bacteroidales bacterium]